MPQQFTRDGVIYYDNGDGTATVVGYENAPIAPPDPSKAFEPQKAQADASRAQAEAALAQAQTPYAAALAQAEAAKLLAEAEKARADAAGGAKTTAQQGEERDRVSRLNQLVQQINRVEQLYRAGPGQTSGLIESLADYLPRDANAKLDVAGAQLSQQGLAAFRVPGTGTVTDRDAVMFDRGNLPTAATRDVANEEIIRGLKARVEEELQSLGQPAPQWGNAPKTKEDEPPIPGSALDMIRLQGGGGGSAVPLADAGTEQYQTVDNPVVERAHNDLVATLIQQGGGRLDPQAYAEGFARLVQEFNVQDRDPAGRVKWAQAMNQYLDAGGRTLPTTLNTQEIMSAGDTARNNLVNNPVSAAAIGVTDTLGYGIPSAFAPGQMAALSDSQPLPMLAGQIGGAIAGTGVVSAVGRNTIGRAIPQLMGQQGVPASQGLSNFARGIRQGREQTLGQVGRNTAADATYGGIYGGMTEGDPLTGIALGTVGSTLGQGVGRALGASVGGAQRTAAAQALKDRGVPVSVARQLGMGRVEDVMQSLPIAGDVARARQAESFQGFNQAAFDIAADPATRLSTPVQIAPGMFGRDGIDGLQAVERQAYNNTLGNVNVGIDPQFTTDFAAAARLVGNLPEDYQSAARDVVAGRVGPAINNGQMTGPDYQQAIRGIRTAKSGAKNVGKAGFEDKYISALNAVEDTLTGVVQRNAGPNVVNDLGLANDVYSNRKILENASLDRARIGTRSGEMNVFTPSQLLDSTRQAEVRYGKGEALRQFGEQGQQVLPTTLPNSGTADRMIALGAIPATAGAIGGGAGFAGAQQDQGAQGAISGTGMGLGTLAATSAILGILGTRGGQKALEQILISRPQIAQQVGQGIRRRGGLFGSTGSTMALQYQ